MATSASQYSYPTIVQPNSAAQHLDASSSYYPPASTTPYQSYYPYYYPSSFKSSGMTFPRQASMASSEMVPADMSGQYKRPAKQYMSDPFRSVMTNLESPNSAFGDYNNFAFDGLTGTESSSANGLPTDYFNTGSSMMNEIYSMPSSEGDTFPLTDPKEEYDFGKKERVSSSLY